MFVNLLAIRCLPKFHPLQSSLFLLSWLYLSAQIPSPKKCEIRLLNQKQLMEVKKYRFNCYGTYLFKKMQVKNTADTGVHLHLSLLFHLSLFFHASLLFHVYLFFHASLFSHVSRFFFFLLKHMFICLFLSLFISLPMTMTMTTRPLSSLCRKHLLSGSECVGLGPSLVGDLLASCRNKLSRCTCCVAWCGVVW